MRREGGVRGKLTSKSRVKRYCRQGTTSRCRSGRLQKSKQKNLSRYKRLAGDVLTNPSASSEFLHHSLAKELQGLVSLASDTAHAMVGHDHDERAVQSGILAATVHSIMEAAFV